VDNQQMGNFSEKDRENIVNAKEQKLEAAFTAQMQTLLATQQKQLKNLLPLPLQTTKGQQPSVEEAKGSEKRKIIRHRSDYCGDCGQDDHTWSSDACPHPGFNARKVQKEGRMKSLLTQMPKGMRGLSISDRVFETAGAVGSSASGRRPILRLVCFTSVSSWC
jgi:hypothetical protein